MRFWPLRLTVRTPGFQPDNTGSIPVGVTKKHLKLGVFYF